MKSYKDLKRITDWYRGISPEDEEWPHATGYAVALLLWLKTQEAAEAEGIDTSTPPESKTDWVGTILEKMKKLSEAPAAEAPVVEAPAAEPAKPVTSTDPESS